MLNVLFVLYHDFTANGAIHVYHWAHELASLGCSCMVAIPQNRASLSSIGPATFQVREFPELECGAIFPDGRGPDVVHAWTPRELVRRQCEQLRSLQSFRQFVHLEDNEHHLLSSFTGRSWSELAGKPASDLDELVPLHLSHPLRSADFLRSADGVTVIIDRLGEFVPGEVPRMELWPSADPDLFSPRPLNRALRAKLGIPSGTTVFAYTGNVHAANTVEVRSLYLAVAILNREGHPAVLLRTGRDFEPFLGPNERWARAHSIELGFIPHREVPGILAAADILVQPGKADQFNDYRFPSKLPEFLAIGRPVILPASNIGLHMSACQAVVLPKVDAIAIVEATRKITADRSLYDRLAKGSREFFEQRLSWQVTAKNLLDFYRNPAAHTRAAQLALTE